MTNTAIMRKNQPLEKVYLSSCSSRLQYVKYLGTQPTKRYIGPIPIQSISLLILPSFFCLLLKRKLVAGNGLVVDIRKSKELFLNYDKSKEVYGMYGIYHRNSM